MTATPQVNPLAGKPAPHSLLVDLPRLITAYYTLAPDAQVPAQRVAFGTSGHRGSAFDSSFNEDHVLAITQAICQYRQQAGHRRAAVPRHRHACVVRAGVRQRARSAGGQRRRGDDRRARRIHADAGRSRTRSSATTAGARPGSPTASSSRRRTIRRPTAASNTTRPTAGRPIPTSPSWIENARQRLPAERARGREARRRYAQALKRAAPRIATTI